MVIAFDQAKKEIRLLEEAIEESEEYLQKRWVYYQKKGYSENWIKERLKSMEVRDDLEALWRKSGIDKPQQFAALTAIISKGVFGITIRSEIYLEIAQESPIKFRRNDIDAVPTELTG